MTAVASPPSFANLNRTGWINGGQSLNSINTDDSRGMNMFGGRKTIQRTNSSSSVSSTASNSSTSTVTSNAQPNGNLMPAGGELSSWASSAPRKRQQTKTPQWNGKPDAASEFARQNPGRPPMSNGLNGPSAMHQAQSMLASQNQIMAQNGNSRPGTEAMGPGRQPVLYLLSLNGTFERKTISVPYYPDTLRIGRQTNAKTVPTPVNGFFDSKVLSRQHAEIWADPSGKIYIRDVKSSNGTFVNGTRLSPENRESDPHELQTQDHLELGIDIVSEDQKTVVHHKVAAKVEHAGFLSQSNSLFDMNLGDLDPSNGAMMMPFVGMPLRGRAGSQASMAGARMAPGNMGMPPNNMPQQRLWLNPITTEQIVKKLHNEMRNARLQHQDLLRTGQFITALLSKDDIKNQDKPEVPAAEPPKNQVNGNVSFRSDGGKTRFSEPPAPPPSQPLPEKPDIARPSSSEIPSLKRGTTERPKSHPSSNTSPIRPDNNLGQIIQLTEALNNAKKEIDTNAARVRDLEEMLNREREARQQAEEAIQKMEETKQVHTNGTAVIPVVNGDSELEKAFDPPSEPTREVSSVPEPPAVPEPSQPDKVEALAAQFQAKIDSMASEMMGLREQLEAFRQRAEKAEAERDADRQTLASMVIQIRQRDEELKRLAEQRLSRSRSKSRSKASTEQQKDIEENHVSVTNGTVLEPSSQLDGPADDAVGAPTLSRANTITPATKMLTATPTADPALIQTLPYASMVGVVLLGMGLMAYLNNWQTQTRLDR
ncbi:vacuolar protein sorting-associated protein 64 [Rhypophila decipiens]